MRWLDSNTAWMVEEGDEGGVACGVGEGEVVMRLCRLQILPTVLPCRQLRMPLHNINLLLLQHL